MSELPARIIRKRNPGMLQSDEEVKEQFVVREHQLATVLEILRGNVDTNSCQHTLIVAPRGRGKTMLLARVAAELRVDAELASRLLPVPFMEESDEILNAADFWLEVLFYLALAVDKQDPETARNLRATRADLTSRWRERELDERARVAVLEAAEALGMRLVLMVENLQALCANVDDDFGWKLRKTLQTEPQIVLVATATSRFEALDDAREPFFELFRIISLPPLDAVQCRRLWKVVSGDVVSEPQIRPLQILTGGSPRFLIIVAEFARHRSLRQLMEELVQLIDDLTDTFRGDLQALAKTERRVFLAAADLWQPSSTGEIATRARMDVRTVSTMLGRLAERGAVIWDGGNRKRLYTVAERLYCIYYKLRRERDEAAIVQSLLHFMTAFYVEREVAAFFGSLAPEALDSPAILAGIERAQSVVPQLNDLAVSLAHTAMTKVNATIEKIEHTKYDAAIEECDDVLKRFGESMTPSLQVQVMKAWINKGVAQGRGGDSTLEIETNRQLIARFGESRDPELQHQIALSLFNTGSAQVRLGDYNAAIRTYEDILRRFGTTNEHELVVQVVRSLINKGWVHGRIGDYPAQIAICRELVSRYGMSDSPELQVEVATALFNAGVALARSGNPMAAIAVCDGLLERYGRSEDSQIESRVAKALLNKGVEQVELGRYAEAIVTFDNLSQRYAATTDVELQACVAQSLGYKAATEDRLGNTEIAIGTTDQVVKRFGQSDDPLLQVPVAGALVQKSACLGRLGHHLETITVSDEVVTRYGDSDDQELQVSVARAMNNKAAAYALLGDATATIATSDTVVACFGTKDAPELQIQVAMTLFYKAMTQIRIGLAQEALQTAEEIDIRHKTAADDVRSTLKWKTLYVRMSAILSQGNLTESVDAFCSVYAAFIPENEGMIPELVEAVTTLVTAGVPEREIIEVLRTDPQKAARVAPLVIALRQRNGEMVRAPAEMLEVAADVRERIDQTDPLPAFT